MERIVWPWCTLKTDCGFGSKEPGKSQNIRLSPPPQTGVEAAFRQDSFLINVGCEVDGFFEAQFACWAAGAHVSQRQVFQLPVDVFLQRPGGRVPPVGVRLQTLADDRLRGRRHGRVERPQPRRRLAAVGEHDR